MRTRTLSKSDRRLATVLVLLVVALPVAAVVVGCGPTRPERVPVSGQVLLDGRPLAQGTIRLYPANARPASARIGPDGRFTLKTFDTGDGAVRGTHPVTVVCLEDLSETKRRWLAPKKYADPKTSGLSATVDDATDSMTIELTWDGGKSFVEQLVNGKWQ